MNQGESGKRRILFYSGIYLVPSSTEFAGWDSPGVPEFGMRYSIN
jgi:hypothetical protein